MTVGAVGMPEAHDGALDPVVDSVLDSVFDPALDRALAELARTPRLLVALDFDGTLAPTVDVPGDARALPAANAAVLRLLELPATRVALVSGRALASLKQVSDLPGGVLLVGSHGVEFELDSDSDSDNGSGSGSASASASDSGGSIPQLGENEHARRAALQQALARVAGRFAHVHLEEKPAGFALHTRLASAEDAAAAEQEALGSADVEGVTWRRGKDVLEFSVRYADKGIALSRLRDYTGASSVLFVGDDVTDEDAFRVLRAGDLGVKVGAGATAAAFSIDGPVAVAPLLTRLAQARLAAPRGVESDAESRAESRTESENERGSRRRDRGGRRR